MHPINDPKSLIRGLILLLTALCLSGAAKASTGTAAFIGSDTTTEGNWQGTYGGDGHMIANGTQSLPAYAAGTLQNQGDWTWAASTTDPRALETGTGGREATTWFSGTTFSVNVNLTDGNTHEVAVYALDWDWRQRAETIQILDAATGTVLDTRSISNFPYGVYLVWNLSGNVKINITNTSSSNAVLSGVFFGGGSAGAVGVTVNPPSVSLNPSQTQQFTATVANASSQSVTWSINPASGTISTSGLYTAPSTITGNQAVTVTATTAGGAKATATVTLTSGATANFVGSDTSTQGNWPGHYGGDGYSISNSSQNIPGYASFSMQNEGNYTWASSTSDPRAPETGSGSARMASTWFNTNAPAFSFDVNFTDGKSHEFSLYALDWDERQRAETIQIVDPSTNSQLDSRSVAGFSGGIYLTWNISGHVHINVTFTAGPNGVVSGAFFGGAGIAANSAAPSPAPATPATVGQLTFSPASYNFGNVNVGSGASQPISLTNSGTASVTVSNVTVSGPGFDASGVSTGVSLSPGQTTTLNVSFTPASTGSVTGSVTIPSTAANSPAVLNLSGTGVQPQTQQHSVMLTWVAPSSSSGIIGYYVFRATGSGAYTQLTSSLITSTTYTDTTVQAGQSYSYAVTSVDASGDQSSYSNIAFATIP